MKQSYLSLKIVLFLFIINLFFLTFLTGCGESPIPPDPPIKVEASPGNISESLMAHIYFDSSASMQGFVAPSSTQYKRILRPLESVITSGWNNGNTKFFRFGNLVRPISRESYIISVGSEEFYDDLRTFIEQIFVNEKISNPSEESNEVETPPNDNNNSNRENHLSVDDENVEINNSPEESVDEQTENRLVVIVTDLFQYRNDVNLLVRQLRDQFISKGLEVGLLGLRSEFNGTIYNLGADRQQYRSTNGDIETYRPFYLLVLGRHADISHYFDRIKASGFPEAETIIFSRYLVDPLLSFDNAEIDRLENLNSVSIAEEENTRVKEYRIWKKNNTSQITAKLELALLSHVMSFDTDKFDVSIIAEYKTDSTGQNQISQDAQNCLEVTSTPNSKGDGNELSHLPPFLYFSVL